MAPGEVTDRLLSRAVLWLAVVAVTFLGITTPGSTIPPDEVIDQWPVSRAVDPANPIAPSADSETRGSARVDVAPVGSRTAAQGTRELPAPEVAELADTEISSRVSGLESHELCGRIGDKLGSVSTDECLSRELALSSGRSVSGAPILVREYPPVQGRDELGRVLLIGGIHGDEYSSVSLVFKWMETLDHHHSGLFHWRVVPLLNPDGLLRKKSQRMNESGVDLNRNFPTPNWENDAVDYWVRRTSRNPRRYPGPRPLSEPESRWLAEEIDRFEPTAIVAVHAPLESVDYDGPPDPPAQLGPLYLSRMGTYPGSLGRYAGEHMGLPVVTIELPSAGIMPSQEEQGRIWSDLVAYLQANLPKHTSQQGATVATGSP